MMEKKYADRIDWKRVTEREFCLRRTKKHIVTCLSMKKVREPLYVTYEHMLCIAGNGYQWYQLFQEDLSYVLTVMVNNDGEIIQYYFDLCVGQGFDPIRQSPWYLDAFLDVVYLPCGDIFILDEDELQDAVDNLVLTSKQERMIQSTTNKLIDNLKANREPLIITFNQIWGGI